MNDNTPVLSNTEKMKEAAFAELREIGRSEGKGKTARLRAAEFIALKAKEGLLDETDNVKAWSEIINGAGEELVDIGGNDVRETQQFKQRASDIKHFIVLGKNPHYDGPAVLHHAVERMKHLRSTGAAKSSRIWELLLGFARAQNNKPTKVLPDKDIDAVMADKVSKTKKKDLAEKLWAERERLIKLNEGYDFEGVYKACDLIEKVVAKELGGTKKQKVEAKEKAKAEKKAAKSPPLAKPSANPGS